MPVQHRLEKEHAGQREIGGGQCERQPFFGREQSEYTKVDAQYRQNGQAIGAMALA